MNLIRNGGFELGNTDFWSVEGNATLEVVPTSDMSGNYMLKVTAGSLSDVYVIHDDYLPVQAGSIVNVSGLFKSASNLDISPYLYFYDSDYSYIGKSYQVYKEMDGNVQSISSDIYVPNRTAYVRVAFKIWSPYSGDILYADSINANMLGQSQGLYRLEEVFNESGVTSSGSTSSDKRDMKACSEFYADMKVTSSSGSSPTLDVEVWERSPTYKDFKVGTFTTATGITEERIKLSNCTGSQLFIKYTIGGTNPSFSFKVYIIGK